MRFIEMFVFVTEKKQKTKGTLKQYPLHPTRPHSRNSLNRPTYDKNKVIHIFLHITQKVMLYPINV